MRKLSRTQVMLALLLIGSLAFLGIAMRGGRPARRHSAADDKGSDGSAAAKVEEKLRPAAPADTDFRRYAALASSPIFSGMQAPPPASSKKKPPLPTPPPFATGPPPPRGPDLGGWTYVGCVTLQSEKLGVMKLGIIQNDATGSVSYLGVGDSFMGGTVESLDQESIRFSSRGAATTLSRPREFPVKPLGAASAGAVSRAPAPGSPPQPRDSGGPR